MQPWWKHAVIYELDVRSFQDSDGSGVGDLRGIQEHLDYLKSLGADAILLDSLATPGHLEGKGRVDTLIDPAVGSLDDFDELSREASRHNIRILLDLHVDASSAKTEVSSVARFWLSRGVAGFRLAGVSADSVSGVRRLVATYAGQRILISDASLATAQQPPISGLALNTALLSVNVSPASKGAMVAEPIRRSMEDVQAVRGGITPLFATDGAGVRRSVSRFNIGPDGLHQKANAGSMAKIMGTVLLLNRSSALLYFGEELGVDPAPGQAFAMPWGAAKLSAAAESGSATEATESAAPAIGSAAPALGTAKEAPDPAPPSTPGPPSAAPSEKYVPYVAPAAPKRSMACDRCTPPIAADPSTASGQDADPKSVLNFYRQLSQLHHGNAALRDGEQIMLNHDDLNAVVWVRKPVLVTQQNPAVVIVCNLSDRPLLLPLKSELARLHLRGSFLKTLLRSDDAMGTMHLEPVAVPPYGVYVGELRY